MYDTRYYPDGGAIIGEGVRDKYYSNRYIYEGNTDAYIMAGDRVHLRFCKNRRMFGTLRMFLDGRPLDLLDDVRLEYTPNVVKWTIRDGGKSFSLTVTTPGDGQGFVLRAEPGSGDPDGETEISFIFRGVSRKDPDPGFSVSDDWNFSIFSDDASLLTTEFDPAWLDNNASGTEGGVCYIENVSMAEDARVFILPDGDVSEENGAVSGSFTRYLIASPEIPGDPEKAFYAGLARGRKIASMLCVETPDEYINAAAQAAAAEMDGAWHPPKTVHGNMCWNTPFVGWMVHGQHILGQHDRSLATLKTYAAAQVREDTKRGFGRNESGTLPADGSRFYGQGYIAEDQGFYNMQTQFFHQMIATWRYGASPEFAAVLRDALRLHLRRGDECFDPDGTGLYESVVNTWPTDSVYTPGGALEETCYAYHAYRALEKLTEGEESKACAEKAEKIKKAFFEKLWIPERGYPGQFVERYGKRRLHKDSWIYAAFMPVECGIAGGFEAVQCVDYPRRALRKNEDGLYWISNWTPGIWSVRECSSGENMQLATAGFRAGRTEEPLRILSDRAKAALDRAMPGELTFPVIESAVQFARAVVEGLFGYTPDYPDGSVVFAPAFPADWDMAAIRTPNFDFRYTRTRVSVTLAKPARLILRLRLYADGLISAEGAESVRLLPGTGGMILEADMGFTGKADLRLTTGAFRDFDAPEELTALPEDMTDIYDPENCAATPWGRHLMFRKTPGGWFREIRLDLGPDPERTELIRRQSAPVPADAVFEPLNISSALNADVCSIFRQRYESLRPEKGCHAEIGYDGFSLWTFPFWGVTPPEIDIGTAGEIKSGLGIPVNIINGERNIAFASLWDNFPDSVSVPVNRRCRMIALAVAGSTNPNLCGAENARLIFRYSGGKEEILPLVNPQNYIQLVPYPPRAATHPYEERSDVFNRYDEDLLTDFTPEVLPLGKNLRALIIRWSVPPDSLLENITLEATCPDVVAGVMAVTVIK